MNKSLIYSGVGVAAAAIIIFAFLGNGSFSRILINQDEKTAKDNSITTTLQLQQRLLRQM
jgi:hypothetical protein